MDRRTFLKRLTMFAGGMALSGLTTKLQAAKRQLELPEYYASDEESAEFWAKPRSVRLHRISTGEKGTFTFWRDGEYIQSEYESICDMLRDVQYKSTKEIDINLLNVLHGASGWIAMNYDLIPTFNVLSGYRTPEHNRNLEGAAKNSLHMRGMAVDGFFDGFPIPFTGQLFAAFQGGGVGFYLNKNFVHVDVGNNRYWLG